MFHSNRTIEQKLCLAIKNYKNALQGNMIIQANRKAKTAYNLAPYYCLDYLDEGQFSKKIIAREFNRIEKYFTLINHLDLSRINREDLFFVIQQFSEDKQFNLLLQSLNQETNLGARFCGSDSDEVCSFETGILKRICERIKELRPEFDLDAYKASIIQNTVTHEMYNSL